MGFGVLGVAALGTVGYGLYAKNNNSKNRKISYQTDYETGYETSYQPSYDTSYQPTYPQKRSAENSNDLDQMWLKVGQLIIKGLMEDEDSSCNSEDQRCLKLSQTANIRTRENINMIESESWTEKCL